MRSRVTRRSRSYSSDSHEDSLNLLQGSATEPPPSQGVMVKMMKKVMKMWSQVEMRVVGTGSSGWVQLTESSVRGSGLN